MKKAVKNIGLLLILLCISLSYAYAGESNTVESNTIKISTKDLSEAAALLADNQSELAYKKLYPYINHMAGNIEFDYLLAKSALNTNRFKSAINALNRILSVDPSFVGARIELAKTYYGQGLRRYSRSALEQSRAEFLNILTMEPPEDLKPVINTYLESIKTHLETRTILKSYSVETAIGYDSNINSGTELEQVTLYDSYLPGIITLKIDHSSKARESVFMQLKLGLGLTLPLYRKNIDLFAHAEVTGRGHISLNAHRLNSNIFNAKFGLRHYGKSNRKTLYINPIARDLDSRYYPSTNPRHTDSFSLNMHWEQLINPQHKLTLKLRGGHSSQQGGHYGDMDSMWAMNVAGLRAGIDWAMLHKGQSKEKTNIMLTIGHDGRDDCKDCCNSCYTPYKRNISSLYIQHSGQITPNTSAYINALIERQRYEYDFFTARRRDLRGELALGLNYQQTRAWTVQPELHLIRQDSKIDLFDFDRTIFTVKSRWTF